MKADPLDPCPCHDRVFIENTHPTVTLYCKEQAGIYRVAETNDVINAAQTILRRQMKDSAVLKSPGIIKDYLMTRLGHLPYELFGMVILDPQNRLVKYMELFRGTVTRTCVYPREVVREAMLHNASGVIFVHNHPSGDVDPSLADQALTQMLKASLELLDIRVLDHLIVGGGNAMSFAERGLL